MTLGNAIKLIRTAKGAKQRDLAKELGVSPNYISLVENGKREPSISLLRALANELDVPVGMFFLWQETPLSKLNQKDRLRELRDLMIQIQAMSIRAQKKSPGERAND